MRHIPAPDWDTQEETRRESLSPPKHLSMASLPGSGGRQRFQLSKEFISNKEHRKEIFADPSRFAMTPEEQDAEIGQAFYNNETMPKE